MATPPVDPVSKVVHSQALIVHPMVAQQARYEALIKKSFELQKEEVRRLPLAGQFILKWLYAASEPTRSAPVS